MSEDTKIPLPAGYYLEPRGYGTDSLNLRNPLGFLVATFDEPKKARAFAAAMNAAQATVPPSHGDGALGELFEALHNWSCERGIEQKDWAHNRLLGSYFSAFPDRLHFRERCDCEPAEDRADCDECMSEAEARAWLRRLRREGKLPEEAPTTHPGAAGQPVTVFYTNWRGETAEREITPTGRILFTSNEWHPEPQWLVEARDARSGEVRLFALTGFGAAGQPVSGSGGVPVSWASEAAVRAQSIRDTVSWLAEHAKGLSLTDWGHHSNVLLNVAIDLDKLASALTPPATASSGAGLTAEDVKITAARALSLAYAAGHGDGVDVQSNRAYKKLCEQIEKLGASSGAAVAVSVEEVERLLDGIARDAAVSAVDAIHGYTMEFAPLPAEHRAEYDSAMSGVLTSLRTHPAIYPLLAAIRSLAAQQDKDGVRETIKKLTMPNGAILECDDPSSRDWAKSWRVTDVKGNSSSGDQDWEIVEEFGLTAILEAALKTAATADQPGRDCEGSACAHDWVNADNEHVQNGALCLKCGLFTARDYLRATGATIRGDDAPSPAPRQDGPPQPDAHPHQEQGQDRGGDDGR